MYNPIYSLRRIILLTVILFVANQALAQDISFQDYGALPDKSMVILSPTGKRVAFRSTSEEKDYLMVVNTEQ